jgi:hypothetical protein
MIDGSGWCHSRFGRSARARWGWRPTTGLRPVPVGGSAPATLGKHFLEGGETGERSIPPVGRARGIRSKQNPYEAATASQTEMAFTQNT